MQKELRNTPIWCCIHATSYHEVAEFVKKDMPPQQHWAAKGGTQNVDLIRNPKFKIVRRFVHTRLSPDAKLKFIKVNNISMDRCEHLNEMRNVTPSAEGCEDCLKIGARWVHLRLCELCGHVGCCDSSPNKHATKHFHTSGHPIIKSFEPGEDWGYCYIDDMFYETLPNI
jgi:hypothetical protein